MNNAKLGQQLVDVVKSNVNDRIKAGLHRQIGIQWYVVDGGSWQRVWRTVEAQVRLSVVSKLKWRWREKL
jgi:hypothetical protein